MSAETISALVVTVIMGLSVSFFWWQAANFGGDPWQSRIMAYNFAAEMTVFAAIYSAVIWAFEDGWIGPFMAVAWLMYLWGKSRGLGLERRLKPEREERVNALVVEHMEQMREKAPFN